MIEPDQALRLDGQVVLVTGGTRGIGRAIVEAAANAGASVSILARKPEELEEAAAAVTRIGAPVHTVQRLGRRRRAPGESDRGDDRRARSLRRGGQQRRDQPRVRAADGRRSRRDHEDLRREHHRPAAFRTRRMARLDARARRRHLERRLRRWDAARSVHRRVQRVESGADPLDPSARAGAGTRRCASTRSRPAS